MSLSPFLKKHKTSLLNCPLIRSEKKGPGVVAHTFGPAFGGRDMDLCEFETSTAYIVRSRRAIATKDDPVLIKQTNKPDKKRRK